MSYLDRQKDFKVAESIGRDLESHGIDVDVPTHLYIVIFDAEDWMEDVAQDILDAYVRTGDIVNYFFEEDLYDTGIRIELD